MSLTSMQKSIINETLSFYLDDISSLPKDKSSQAIMAFQAMMEKELDPVIEVELHTQYDNTGATTLLESVTNFRSILFNNSPKKYLNLCKENDIDYPNVEDEEIRKYLKSIIIEKIAIIKAQEILNFYEYCIKNYNANMDDMKIILSSLPKEFPEDKILDLYLKAQEAKANPNYEEFEQIDPQKIKEFKPEFNHDIIKIIERKYFTTNETSNPDQEWLTEYSNAKLFADNIAEEKKKKITALIELKRKQNQPKLALLDREQEAFQQNKQNTHQIDTDTQNIFQKLKQRYPQCDINKNFLEVKNFFNKQTDQDILPKNKEFIKNFLQYIEIDRASNSAIEYVGYAWEAIKHAEHLTGSNAKEIKDVKLLQENLKQNLLVQLMLIETTYKDPKNLNYGRSCTYGTKNAIIQMLDGYHQDVDVNYSFKEKIMSISGLDLAKDIYKEFLLEELQNLSIEIRAQILKNWDPKASLANQVQLDTELRLKLDYAMKEAEDKLLNKYYSYYETWFNQHKELVKANLSISKIDLLKPAMDLIYQYKQLLAKQNYTYSQMVKEIENGGNIKHISQLPNFGFSDDVLNIAIPTIKKQDLQSLADDILNKNYQNIMNRSFNNLSAEEKVIALSCYKNNFFGTNFPDDDAVLTRALIDKFNKEAKAPYHYSLIQAFKKEENKESIAKAMFDGSITGVNELKNQDFEFLKEAYKIRIDILNKKFLELKKEKVSPTRAEKLKELSQEYDQTRSILAQVYIDNIAVIWSNPKEILNQNDISKAEKLFSEILNHEDKDLTEVFIQKRSSTRNSSPLVIAACYQNKQAVKEMIRRKEDINFQNSDGNTALTYAATSGNLEILSDLIDAGAKINIKNNEDGNALTISIWHENIETTNKLIEAGADINYEDKINNYTPLMYAIEKNNTKIVESLIKAGANVNLRNKKGESAIMLAVRQGKSEIVEQLIEAGAELNVRYRDGNTIFALARKNLKKNPNNENHATIVNSLMSKNINCNVPYYSGSGPEHKFKKLKEAIKDGDIEYVKYFISNNKDLKDKYLNRLTGKTFVSYAIRHEKPQVAAYLFKEGFIAEKTWTDFFKTMFLSKKSKEKYILENKLDEKTKEEYKKLIDQDGELIHQEKFKAISDSLKNEKLLEGNLSTQMQEALKDLSKKEQKKLNDILNSTETLEPVKSQKDNEEQNEAEIRNSRLSHTRSSI